MDKVDATMASVNEQRELANEISETIANPIYDANVDEVCIDFLRPVLCNSISFTQDELKAELEELEQDELNTRLSEADHVPVHLPPGARVEESEFLVFSGCVADLNVVSISERTPVATEDDEEAQLRELQAALAM
jgi:charged multivesicular body protein 4